MRWFLILILFISCQDNTEEEMRLFVSSLSNSESTPTPPPFPENGVRVFLQTGQSNSRGRGLNSDATPEELAIQPQMKIWRLHTGGGFDDLEVPVNNQTSGTTHSIELGLAKYFNDYYPDEIGYIIKVGIDGTPIIEHLPGGEVYDNFYPNFAIPGINRLISEGKIPYVYMIYSQGEADANPTNWPDGNNPTNYVARFDSWVAQWRSNIGADLPIVVYQILDTYDPGSGQINEIFINKDASDDKLHMLATGDLPSVGDNLHFNYTAQKEASVMALDYFINHLGQPVTEPL